MYLGFLLIAIKPLLLKLPMCFLKMLSRPDFNRPFLLSSVSSVSFCSFFKSFQDSQLPFSQKYSKFQTSSFFRKNTLISYLENGFAFDGMMFHTSF